MPRLNTQAKTKLKELRKGANLTLRQAVQKLHELEPKAPASIVGLKHIENRGTDRLYLLQALARVYNVDLEHVQEAAQRHYS